MKNDRSVILGLVLAISAAALAVGCDGEGTGSGGIWACDTRADNNACIQYAGSEWTGPRRSNYEAVCLGHAPPGTIASSCPFPTGGLGGTCRTFIGTATEQTLFYYYDSAGQATTCTTVMSGVWTDATP
jgi:hypothetical protein